MKSFSDTLLLSTKLNMPAPRRNYVVRRTLFDRLSHCADMSVIFVCGGAGTGKTTLLSSFIREKGLANVGWLSLDASNSNVYSFWLYFAAAVNTFLPDDGGFLDLMRSNFDASHMQRLLTVLINRLCGEEDYYIVLDDVHCISDAALIRTLEFFLGAMPENLHLFLLSREDPPVYLGPLAVSGRLLYIDGRQMRLSPEEGIAFLKQTLRFSGSDEEVTRLNDYAEGWIGGLQLAAAAEAMGKRSGKLLRAGGGIAADYLTREIFESLSLRERDFLVCTGYLAYFDADICAQLFKNFQKADFDAMIENLTEKNLFVVCVDERGGVYRYHNILSEYLTRQFSQLPAERGSELLKKSAAAFEKRGDAEEALRLLNMAGDYEGVMRVARAMDGGIEAWSYLDRVPLDLLIQDADLAAQCMMYDIGNLDAGHFRKLFEKFKECYSGTDLFTVMKFAQAYVSKDSRILPEYQVLTAKQIDGLKLGPVAKAMVFVENSVALKEHLKYEEAESCIDKAFEICAGANIFVDFAAYGQKAQLCEEMGRLNESLACYDRAMELFKSPSMMSGLGTNYYFGIAGVYMRRMELDKAEKALEKSKRNAEKQHICFDIVDMTLYYHLGELNFLRGNPDKGKTYFDAIISKFPAYSILTLGRPLMELNCAGLLEPRYADIFLSELEASAVYRIQPFMRNLRARILFERGETAQALRETEQVLAFSREHKNRLRLVETGILKIFMLSKSPETAGSRREIGNLLRETVYYAYENRILMPYFLDRDTLLPLLEELAAKSPEKSGLNPGEMKFVRDAITLCGGSDVSQPKGPDDLSARELEVLGELAQGITNREIAEKLCISQATVKTHVLSIFGKLGVSSRMMAVGEGRKRGLIP